MPECCAPGRDFAKLLVLLATERKSRPTRASRGLHFEFERFLTRQISVSDAAQLDLEFQRCAFGGAHAPVHVEADGRALFRMPAELGLIRIAVEEAGRKGMAALQIQKMR